MHVKCLLAEGQEANLSMMELMNMAHGSRGKRSLMELINEPREGVISLIKGAGALFITGGRDSIQSFLVNHAIGPDILGVRPLRVSFARKHRTLGKNETCVKLVSGMGHNTPEDGSQFQDLGFYNQSGAPLLRIRPMELNFALWKLYGWG